MYYTKGLELLGSLGFLDLHRLHPGMGWALVTPRDELIHPYWRPLDGGFDITIPRVSHPAPQPQPKRLFLRALAKEYPLHPARYA